ncbi:MAG: hypothetical protein ACI3W5_12885 [Faecousia sp.]
MKCFNCGRETSAYLCRDCLTAPVLDRVFTEIRFYKPDACDNSFLAEYASTLTEKYEERNCIPEILDQFDFEISEYYYCQYYRMRRDPRFEAAAESYLAAHPWPEVKSQRVIFDLLESYMRENFVKPRKWCDWITDTEDLCCELYADASQYYAMIGEYDLSDAIADKALQYCSAPVYDHFLFYSKENMVSRLEKQKTDTQRYRTKKPYWPSTEARRRAVAMFYDEKGIQYPRIENRPEKVRENAFAPINECFDDELEDYCAFWCAEAFILSAAKGIYQIAAVKVRGGQITDVFQSLIRPWDGTAARKDAAKKANVDLSVIESAEDVDLVMPKFFSFVGDDTLVSTGALGNQAKLISRAARYAGMKEIPNAFYDLLDLAADTSTDFDLANNTREYLLSHFSIPEGADSLEKAKINKRLYDALKDYGD